MGRRQELRHLSPEQRQAAAAGIEDLVGDAHARGGRRDSRSRGTGRVSLSQRPGAEVSRSPDCPSDRSRAAATIDIAPNSTTETTAFHVLPAAARLENFQPHMHLRGKAMAMEAILPDGTTQMLSYVNNFNFNWMTNYIYADDSAPVLPKGTILHITAWYDNTRE